MGPTTAFFLAPPPGAQETQFLFKTSQLNPLLHRLFLDHDIILGNIEKIQEKFKISFEYIMENGAFALLEVLRGPSFPFCGT